MATYNWTLELVCNPPNGGTIAAPALFGTEECGVSPLVNVTATPKSNCGWVFNSFVVYLENGRYWAAFYNNPLTRIPRSISREEGETLPLKIVASFTFFGAGKLMRSSQQPSKLVRDGDKLIIDR